MKINNIPKIIFYLLIVFSLILCIYMMIEYFFFKVPPELEMGPFSAWISACCSIATLGFAILALHNWTHSKNNEEAYSLAKKIIIEDYCKTIISIRRLEQNIVIYHSTLLFTFTIPGFTPNTPLFQKGELKEKLILSDEIRISSLESKYNVVAINKLGFKLKEEASQLKEELDKSIDANLQCITFFINEYEKIVSYINSGKTPQRTLPTNYSRNYIEYTKTVKDVTANFDKFMDNQNSFFEYFNRK